MSSQAKLIQPSAPPMVDARAVEHAAFRIAERIAAGAGLCVLAPVLGSAGLLITLLSRRSPLIAHRRIGQNGEPFWLLKLRTMWDNGEEGRQRFRLVEYIRDEHGPRRKNSADPRVRGRFARFLRRTSIDELPQLVHVLTGRMSLVGPRPLTRTELEMHYGECAEEVLRVRPGLTGLWQVMGRNRLTYSQRRRLDLFYVQRRSPAIYLMILARTLPLVLSGKDSW
jgi:exopolysaccharide production protein ExoY